MRNTLTYLGVFLTLLLALDLANVKGVDLKFIDALERQAYDFRVRLSAEDEVDSRVVIIDVDERSMKVEGQWPWPRPRFAQMINQLFDRYQIDTLGFDVIFPEAEDSYTDDRIARLAAEESNSQQLIDRLRNESGDVLFARAVKDRSVVLGCVFQTIDPLQSVIPSVGALARPAFMESEFDYQTILRETNAPTTQRYTSNIPILAESAAATGFFSIADQVGDPDGIIRRVELLTRFEDRLYASLALQLVQTYFMSEAEPILLDDPDDGYNGLEGLRLIHADIPLDAQAAVYVPYSKPRTAYAYISATDIISGEFAGDISGAIAIVGTSAAGLVDLRSTPVGASLPGVEVHANIVSAMLDGNFRIKPSWVTAADLLLLFAIGLLLSFAVPRLSALWSTVLFLSAAGATTALNWYFWSEKMMILTIGPILLLITTIYLIDMLVGFFSESQARKVTQKMFGLYVPPEVVGEMSTNTDIFSLKSERRELTVFFCDIRGFTTISESMEPEELSDWLNDFLTPMTRIIHKHGGAIDKYMGDAIMAFWGAPMENPEHARNALCAGLEMIEYLDTLNSEAREKDWPEIKIGIGLNSGIMSVGNMGSEFRMAYTVIGDAVNLGSRLEGLSKYYGVDIVVSETTSQQAAEFVYQELDRVRVKGKHEPVTIYQPVCTHENLTADKAGELKQFALAIDLYRHQDWDKAEVEMRALIAQYPQTKLYALYLSRIAILRDSPPGVDWDGVFVHESK
ncbi:MAG: adenylate/guanylate cyclase domain-containing protein [Gammaproteobacteria bacterium]|nr:adenylate/guanylate cyclase domain-containing protein [Gammaproteobacteria bacterium]